MIKNQTALQARNKVIKLYDDYSTIASEAKRKTIHEEGIEVLTTKQMLQRLPIALAEVNAGNTSEKLLNKIRKTIHSSFFVLSKGNYQKTIQQYNEFNTIITQNGYYIYEF